MSALNIVRSSYQLRVVVVAVLTILLSGIAYRLLPHLGFVSELTVSGGIFSDLNKFADIWVVPFAVAVQVVGMTLIWRAPRHRIETHDESNTTSTVLIGAMAIIFAAIMIYFGREITLVPLLSLVLGYFVTRNVLPARPNFVSSLALLSTTAVTWLANHFLGTPVLWIFSSAFLVFSLAISLGSRVNGLLQVVYLITVFIIAGQLATLSPYFWLPKEVGGNLNGLDFVVWGVAGLVIFQALRSVWRSHFEGTNPVSPLMLAVGLFLVTTYEINPFVLPTDDYHFGETFLANKAIFDDWGYFSTFFSPHGLSDAAGSIGAWLIADYSASGIIIGKAYFLFGIKLAIFWQIYRFSGPIFGALLCLALPHTYESYGVILLGMLVLQAGLINSSVIASTAVVLLCAAGVFAFGGQGVAVSISTFLAVLTVRRESKFKEFTIFLATGAVVFLILMIPFSEQILNNIAFLKSSSESNLNIYGNGSLFGGIAARYIIAVIIFSLLPLVVFLLVFSSSSIYSNRISGLTLAMTLLPIVVFVLLYDSYAMSRLDATAPRAFMAAVTGLIIVAAWISILGIRTGGKRFSADGIGWNQAACAALVLLAVAPYSNMINSLSRHATLMPPQRGATPRQIDQEIPQLGFGAFDAKHVKRIRVAKALVDRLLLPDETFLDLSNRNAIYFYLDRQPPGAISSTYNAAADGLQRRVLSDLRKNRPALAIVSFNNYEHDGYSLPLRSHGIYRYVIENYLPFRYQGYIFALRKDLFERVNRLEPELDFSLNSVSDINWTHGIAIGANANTWSFAVPGNMADKILKDDVLIFSDGIRRKVVNAKGMNVRVTPSLEGLDGNKLSFNVEGRNYTLTALQLWAKAFLRRNLNRIPSAWGRSAKGLDEKLERGSIAFKLLQTRGVSAGSNPMQYRVIGKDPQWIYRSDIKINPRENGILRIKTSCINPKITPQVQVFWRQNGENFSEAHSVIFTASYPINLIPLDAVPDWYLAQGIAEIRIDVDGCETTNMEAIHLMSRKPLSSN